MSNRICFESRRVGRVEFEESAVVEFESLPGFPDRSRYVFIEHDDDSPLGWLVCLDDPDLAFVVAAPWAFFPNYDPPVEREHLATLGIEKKVEVEILSIVTFSGKTINLNLAAPLLINSTTRRGLQVVSEDRSYATRTPIPKLQADTKSANSANNASKGTSESVTSEKADDTTRAPDAAPLAP